MIFLKNSFFIFIGVILIFSLPAMAQNTPQKKGPLKISADTALEWHRDDHQYVARGNVVISQDNMTLTADHVVADYRDPQDKTDKKGGINIYRLTATGKNVILKTATETATGTRAVYDHDTNSATLEGPVTITRDKNILRGARATIDLTTQKSTLLGDPKTGGRVTGVFYTEELKKK